MALIETINSSNIYHMACRMGRGEQFGYKGWRAIGDYLEQLSEDIGEDIEVDIVGICCDYSSADSADEWLAEYGPWSDIDPDALEEMDEEEKLKVIEDYLSRNTSVVICEEDCIIWQTF